MLLKIPLLLFSQGWRIDSDSFAPLPSFYLDSIIPSFHRFCLALFGCNSQEFLLGMGLQPKEPSVGSIANAENSDYRMLQCCQTWGHLGLIH